MSREQLAKAYVEWVNNYLTINAYAEHHGLTYTEADEFIKVARSCYYNPNPEA